MPETAQSPTPPYLAAVNGHSPQVDPSAFIAPGASLIGRVEVGPEASIWFGCVLRGDINYIRVGAQTNLQDQCVVHVSHQGQGTEIGSRVSVGHRAVLHSCTIEDEVLVGMGAVVLDRARVGQGAMVGAGAVVPPGLEIPPRHLALGVPAKVVRPLTPQEIEANRGVLRRYLKVVECYRDPALEVDFSQVE